MGLHGIHHRIGRARPLGLAAALAVALSMTLPAAPASAADVSLTNGGFETGDLTGWSGGGAWVTSNHNGYTAPSGNYFGVIQGGCYTNRLAQSFTAAAGQTLSGWTFFQAGDYWPFNDSGSVELEVSGGGHVATVFWSSVGQVGSYGGTGWRSWSYTFPSSGTYTVAAYSSNSGDCGVNSVIGLDFEETPPDTSAPVITASATSAGAPYTPGEWAGSEVTVHFDCTDDGSGVASVTGDQTMGEGDGDSVTGTCTDVAGNSSSTTFGDIRVDTTVPVVTWSGSAGTYAVDQQVTLGCAASDALSGVASSTCASVTGPAYSFGLGDHTYTASATDLAGNQASGSTTFTVVVGFDSLCGLTATFSTSAGVTNGLCAKLQAASAAAARGQVKTSRNNLAAYGNQVAAQTGKSLTSDQASVLLALAAVL